MYIYCSYELMKCIIICCYFKINPIINTKLSETSFSCHCVLYGIKYNFIGFHIKYSIFLLEKRFPGNSRDFPGNAISISRFPGKCKTSGNVKPYTEQKGMGLKNQGSYRTITGGA